MHTRSLLSLQGGRALVSAPLCGNVPLFLWEAVGPLLSSVSKPCGRQRPAAVALRCRAFCPSIRSVRHLLYFYKVNHTAATDNESFRAQWERHVKGTSGQGEQASIRLAFKQLSAVIALSCLLLPAVPRGALRSLGFRFTYGIPPVTLALTVQPAHTQCFGPPWMVHGLFFGLSVDSTLPCLGDAQEMPMSSEGDRTSRKWCWLPRRVDALWLRKAQAGCHL